MFRALCLLALTLRVYANPVPLPTPPPVETGTTAADGVGALASPPCTTILTSLISGFHGDFTAEIAQTVYTKTETVYSRVNCDGCALSITTELAKFWGGFGPQEVITATVTAKEASTTTLTVCSHHMTPVPHGQVPRDVETPDTPAASSSGGECTVTKVILPTPQVLGNGSRTVYTTSATLTSRIDCGGCNYVEVSTNNFLHPGPMVPYTATTTATSATAVTTYVCSKSPSAFLTPSSLRTLPIVHPTAEAHRERGDRRAETSPTTTSSPPDTSPAAEFTIQRTITKTIYAATVTAVKTTACGPLRGPLTSQGAIPKREEGNSDHKSKPRTLTLYSTLVINAPTTWTRTSFHCVSEKPKPTPTLTRIPGIGAIPRAAATAPPTHPPKPVSPSGTTTTYTFPPKG